MAKSKAAKLPPAKVADREEKKKALAAAIALIEKDFGEGAVMFMSGSKSRMNVESIPTGSLNLDLALGIGGLPKGRIIEIYGQESGGKTTVSLHTIAETQKLGGTAAFVDVEHALDPVYAKKLGVNVDDLIVSQPDTGEQALEIMERLVRSGAIDIIVLDSVAAMVTRAEIEGEMGDSHVGQQARLMSAAMRKLTSVISKTGTVAIFINQVREKIGGYGNPETTPGGRALKFYASVRIQVSKTSDKIMNGTEQIGVRTKCKVVKNKVAPPFKSCEFDMIYGTGISKVGEILDLALEIDVCKKSGAWFYYGDMRLGQGRDNAKKYLLENRDLMDEIEKKIREKSDELDMNESVGDIADSHFSDSEREHAPLPEEPAAKKSSAKKGKKAILIESEEDFEEFSPDEL
ncbi:MAG: recombinase RecA [Oscillospiraceae bacterium]|jgi:recombination protein RecA|nr:recombinase RecA [Oscillospiraceae bacterium]